ncbi:MAG: hypothetical protein ABWY93_18845 [Mycobacterium sp.]
MISTKDALVAAMAGGYTSPLGWYNLGSGGTGAGAQNSGWIAGHRRGDLPAVGVAATCSSSTPGAVPLPATTAGNSWYLGAVSMTFSSGQAWLYDRLAQVRLDTTVTTAQPMSLTRPARSTSAHGVHAWLEIAVNSTAMAIPNSPVSYTNSDGVPGRTGSFGATGGTIYNASPTYPGLMLPMFLQTGDRGVSSIESVTLGSTLPMSVIVHLSRNIFTAGFGWQTASVQAGFLDLGATSLGADPCLFTAILGGTQQLHGALRMIQG